ERVVVIQPGSRNLRLGLATDAFPKIVPHVIARRVHTANHEAAAQANALPVKLGNDDDDAFLAALEGAEQELNYRLTKRKLINNPHQQVLSFNEPSQPEKIPDHNDPYRVEWTDVEAQPDHVALRIPHGTPDYLVRYPIRNGALNQRDYKSLQEAAGDLATLWTDVFYEELNIEASELKDYHAVLVVPDAFHRPTVLEMVQVLLQHMNLRAVVVTQDAVACTFGAGTSLACVVDLGAQTTSVTCVEDGFCIAGSKHRMVYGGDDMTVFFCDLLRQSAFPYREIDLTRMYDWLLAEELKERFCSMSEADLAVRTQMFYVRLPGQTTQKYSLKMFDETMLVTLLPFVPRVLAYRKKMADLATLARGSSTFGLSEAQDDYSIQDENAMAIDGTPSSATAAADTDPLWLALDEAIARSISTASSDDRVKKLYGNIICVGGGALIPGLADALEDRLRYSASVLALGTDRVRVVTHPRDMDPRAVAWKGAAVMSRLDCASEMWLSRSEWAEAGLRCLRER
ncbi:hypothetical protein THASP1DRAFT_11390, partial [Thamnocephalis sphaerospora]